MDEELWQKAQALFTAALEREPAGREAFVRESCAGDERLGDAVLKPLRADDQASAFLEDLIGAGAESVIRSEPVVRRRHLPEPEEIVGRYQIKREIGHGGMSTVYLAVGQGDGFQRRVALKLIRRGMDTEDILRRFRTERQILAALEHPNIAMLLDGGSTADGRPYFVMEYIEGIPIDEYCDAHELSIPQRLRLFSTVCAAVHYAHQNLVVHRDIKPENILVTEQGVPKLLDFGIAKLLHSDASASTVQLTAAGWAPMTPEYASPEQIQGRPIATTSDVYSLGVLLNVLLSGHLPYRLPDRGTDTLEKAIGEVEPVPPSSSAAMDEIVVTDHGTTTVSRERIARARGETPARLRRKLSGDLDRIVLMALRKDPQRRYGSALQLAEDIQRYLRGRPVRAHKDTRRYRAGKFIRRNKAAVAGMALIVVFAAAMTFASARVQQQRDLVSLERDRVAQVSGFLMNLFDLGDKTGIRARTITAREILDAGASRLQREGGLEPALRAKLLGAIGSVYVSLGLYKLAEPLLEQSLEVRRTTPGRSASDLAESLHGLGALRYGQGEYPQAESLYRESLALRQKRAGEDPLVLASAQDDLGEALVQIGSFSEAESLFTSALATQRKNEGANPVAVARSIHDIGWVLFRQGKAVEAEPFCRQALELRRRLLRPDHPDVARSANNLAIVRWMRLDLAEAERLSRETLEIRRKAFGPEHPDVGSAMVNLGGILNEEGRFGEAEPMLRAALEIKQRFQGPAHLEVANTWITLASTLQSEGKLDEAEAGYRKGLAIMRKQLRKWHPDLGDPLSRLGSLLMQKGEYREARLLLEEELELERRIDSTSDLAADAACALGAALVGLHEYSEAESLLANNWAQLVPKDSSSAEAAEAALDCLIDLYKRTDRPDRAAEYEARKRELAAGPSPGGR